MRMRVGEEKISLFFTGIIRTHEDDYRFQAWVK